MTLRLRQTPDGAIDPRGDYVQGRRGERFVYINSGTFAAQTDSCWSRRTKVSLRDIDAALIVQVGPGGALAATIRGRAGDGGPCCADVPLLHGWQVVQR